MSLLPCWEGSKEKLERERSSNSSSIGNNLRTKNQILGRSPLVEVRGKQARLHGPAFCDKEFGKPARARDYENFIMEPWRRFKVIILS
jgi:hypothetical protein